MNDHILTTGKGLSHLNGITWLRANIRLIAKAISEFTHEKIFGPILLEDHPDGWGRYSLPTDNPLVTYSFKARRLALDHWVVNAGSITKSVGQLVAEPDMQQFVMETYRTLGISSQLLPVYLEEITSTLNGMAYKAYSNTHTSSELVHGDFQTIEHAMTEGHPCFIANNGRLGFDSEEYHLYTPEANHPFRILWVAGHRSRAAFHAIEGLDYDTVMKQELGTDTVVRFQSILSSRGLDSREYVFIPVHPWQWKHKISTLFAHDIARQYLVLLDESTDFYSAQQSIRTLYNYSSPKKYYVKTALSILNMGFMRGLSPYYMQSTPCITDWIEKLLGDDPELVKCGFCMLRELATAGYRNPLYEPLGKTLPQNKMLSALWRESPLTKISEGRQLMTMAALLHVDPYGDALIVEMIKASGLPVEDWLSSYLNCYLRPLVHCFYNYELVFMPHGENLVLVIENHVPVKAIMKDITEEVIVFNENLQLEGPAKRLLKTTTDELKLSYIFTDVFDCFFRFLSAILVEHGGFEEQVFWKKTAACIRDYQDEHPELSAQYERYNFFQKSFKRCCLNRLQLKDTTQMLNLDDPFGSLQWTGNIDNPIAPFKEAPL